MNSVAFDFHFRFEFEFIDRRNFLGDYAVLIQSGFSHYRAILWNFLSATTAFIGFFIGVGLSSDATVRQWIFAVTVGMFLYIALVDLVNFFLRLVLIRWKVEKHFPFSYRRF